ncbi:hypothetical protein [Methylobacterium soli]|uniref:Uncharacterized protein n=1 Tax=Methylobacterium soli TaxID=553447 RepID=A0A6L3SVJ9_9HYPH|nr:hypothetical protein [Methylobacterium soli]KAB1077772.1 hypothetical protein F6X53_17590 [Methylobacterium soli]GJE42898.1 hypothetical protein AEGHOMDF_2072 [Methylobacterium soli]
MKLVIGYMHDRNDNDQLNEIIKIHHLTMRRNLYAKLVEFIKVFNDYSIKLVRHKKQSEREYGEKISDKIETWTSTVEYEFAKKMRTSATHHYLSEDAHKHVEMFPKNYQFSLLHHPQPTNSFFPASEDIYHLSLLEEDEAKGMKISKMNDWLETILPDLNELHLKFLERIFELFKTVHGHKRVIFADDELIFDADTRFPILYYSGRNSRF